MAPIDWENLKKRSGMPEVIEEWRKGLASVKYPEYDGNEVAETAAVFKTLIACLLYTSPSPRDPE